MYVAAVSIYDFWLELYNAVLAVPFVVNFNNHTDKNIDKCKQNKNRLLK